VAELLTIEQTLPACYIGGTFVRVSFQSWVDRHTATLRKSWIQPRSSKVYFRYLMCCFISKQGSIKGQISHLLTPC